MSDDREWDDCDDCGVTMKPRNVGGVAATLGPLCPACWPEACPDCGGGPFHWSEYYGRFECDNGCGPFTVAEVIDE